ncbi:MAG: FKBP-type peptidyl-prolyl cis-trans isomerase [Rubritalea sp.]|uniref:FKBP-type peptidyl-prolyl cis-trans isomerase n=1 Tax=Rubritalea sp. TaxID=2109375 RepID=UPI00324300B6
MKKTRTKQLILAGMGAMLTYGAINLVNAANVETPADVAAAPVGAEKTASGLASKVLKKGTGTEKPGARDEVTVHYSGWTLDGKLFDSSVQRGQTTSFPLNQVIKGWTEGLQLMVVGEKRRFWIPAELAYGENPGGGRPGGMLCFDVELFDIKKAPEAPKPPKNVAAAPADAQKTPSGVPTQIVTKGEGSKTAEENDQVTMHYSVWLADGDLLESSKMKGDPIVVAPNKLPIPAWSEAVQLMTKGETRLIWLSSEQAFGENPPPGAPKGAVCFEIDLVDMKSMPAPPATPKDVAAAPADAEKTASGLLSKVLTKGTGAEKPKATSTVEVHYSGWTLDGKMFDSSVTRGQTTSFGLNQVIPGWTEGLQLMVEGEKRRFWIPADLAYGENPGGGRPGGMLCFDVELVKIK